MKSMELLLLVVCLCVLAYTQDPPVINDNFESHMVGSFWNRTDFVQLVEHVWEDLDDKLQRIDTWLNGTQVTVILRFDQDPPMEYVIRDKKTCDKYSLGSRKMQPWFDWLKGATSHGTCKVNFFSGTRWVLHVQHMRISLCYGPSGPLDVLVEDHHIRHEPQFRMGVFEDFIPGTPVKTNFDVPAICNSKHAEPIFFYPKHLL